MHAVDGRPQREKTLPKRFDPRSVLQDPMSTKQTRAKRTIKSRGGIVVVKLPWVTNSLGPPSGSRREFPCRLNTSPWTIVAEGIQLAWNEMKAETNMNRHVRNKIMCVCVCFYPLCLQSSATIYMHLHRFLSKPHIFVHQQTGTQLFQHVCLHASKAAHPTYVQ